MHDTRARFAGAVQTARSAMLLLAACSGADDTMLADEGAPEAGAAATTHSTIAPAAASGLGGAMQSAVRQRVVGRSRRLWPRRHPAPPERHQPHRRDRRQRLRAKHRSILQTGPGLLAADPQRNLLFSLHMYESFADPPTITSALTRAAALTLPLIVGEFGWVHGGRAIDYEFIMSEAERLGVGFLAWSWKGNSGGDEALDLAIDWHGEQLSDYASVVMSRIAATSERASIFE